MYSQIPLRAAEASAPPAVLDRRLTVLMACATGFAIANIYYNQPLLGVIGADLGDPRAAGLIPTATQLGYALGVLLLVPLGDQVDRRRLIVGQFATLVLALLAAATAPDPTFLVVASGVVGLLASTAQQVIPFAAELAPSHGRGRAVGTVMSGLLVGILLAPTLSGTVGHWFGWRAIFMMAAGLAAAMAAVLAVGLPRSQPAPRQPYPRLIASLWHLARTVPELRRAAATQGLLFAGFSAFWTTLALLLQSPRFGLGSDVAGLFGILALGGVAAAPIAGRLADAGGPDRIVRLGAALVLASFLLMALHAGLATLSIGVVLMDAGVQMAMIGNQAAVYAMAGAARGRFNTVFITAMFATGAAGSAAAGLAWQHGGWPAVMATAAGPAALALLLQPRPCRPRRAPHRESTSMTKNPSTRVGDFAVATLWDGDFPCGTDVVPRAASEAGRALFRSAGLPPDGPSPEPINAFALTRGGRLWLVDAGVGDVMPGFGAAPFRLAASGYAPEAVDTIVLTHLHPDHIGGLIRGGARAYPEARLLVPEVELRFWTDPRSPASSCEPTSNFELARAVLDRYAGAVEGVPEGASIAPGLRFVPLPGHTPGHSGVMIEDGGERLLIWADIVHSRLLQFAHPEWDVAFDDDPALAVATRLSLLPDLVESGLRVGGSHLTGFGRIERGDGFTMAVEGGAS